MSRAGSRRGSVRAATCELGTVSVGSSKTVRVRRAVGHGCPGSSRGPRGCHALMCAHQDLSERRRREQRTIARSYRSGGRGGRRRDAALRYSSEVDFSCSQGRLRAPPEPGGLRLARFAASFSLRRRDVVPGTSSSLGGRVWPPHTSPARASADAERRAYGGAHGRAHGLPRGRAPTLHKYAIDA